MINKHMEKQKSIRTESDVLPELLPLLKRRPIVNLLDPPDLHDLTAVPIADERVSISVKTISCSDRSIRIVCYSSKRKQHIPRPALLWIHGGGYFAGNPESDSAICEQLVLDADCFVFAVDYRLAPAAPYPAGLEDCYAALCWMHDNARLLGINRRRIAVGGVSAGGGLTAALALLARDRGGPSIAFQMPLYPMLDDRNVTVSSQQITAENFPHTWNRQHNLLAWKWYLSELDDRNLIPYYAAPARTQDLQGLPAAYLCIGELDLFRDETITYATRLLQSGVPTELHVYPGCYHAFETESDEIEICSYARAEYVAALRKAIHKRETDSISELPPR